MRLEEQETQARSYWLKMTTKKSHTILDVKLFLDKIYIFVSKKKNLKTIWKM